MADLVAKKVCSAAEAIALIPSDAYLTVGGKPCSHWRKFDRPLGFVGAGAPEDLLQALQQRYLTTLQPKFAFGKLVMTDPAQEHTSCVPSWPR
jgi:acyl CoA:acetate/3-ketoacid CoA transferase